jgi:hypothetical protein
MPSPALTRFNEAVDASALSVAMKSTVKGWGLRLYPAVVKEVSEHIRKHLVDEANSRQPSQGLTDRRELIEAVLDRARDTDDNLALIIADALAPGPTRRA